MGPGIETMILDLSLTFSPLAPASPRRPGSPGGPCRETRSHSPQNLRLPPWLWSLPSHPYVPVTYHRTWGPSLTCGSRAALLTLKVRENTAGSGGLSPHYTPPTVFTLPTPSYCNLPLSLGAPVDHQGQAFLLGLQDPRSLSFLGPRQHQGPPETHRKNLFSRQRGAEGGRGGQKEV